MVYMMAETGFCLLTSGQTSSVTAICRLLWMWDINRECVVFDILSILSTGDYKGEIVSFKPAPLEKNEFL